MQLDFSDTIKCIQDFSEELFVDATYYKIIENIGYYIAIISSGSTGNKFYYCPITVPKLVFARSKNIVDRVIHYCNTSFIDYEHYTDYYIKFLFVRGNVVQVELRLQR